MNEVIIDFGSDKKNNIKNYICGGSFYVALTRVKEGAKVFLKSFDESYIKVDERIEEKMAAMRLHMSMNLRKFFLMIQCSTTKKKKQKWDILILMD